MTKVQYKINYHILTKPKRNLSKIDTSKNISGHHLRRGQKIFQRLILFLPSPFLDTTQDGNQFHKIINSFFSPCLPINFRCLSQQRLFLTRRPLIYQLFRNNKWKKKQIANMSSANWIQTFFYTQHTWLFKYYNKNLSIFFPKDFVNYFLDLAQIFGSISLIYSVHHVNSHSNRVILQ